jgi:hypothetical protein
MYNILVYKVSVSLSLAQQNMPQFIQLMLQRLSSHLNGRKIDRYEVYASYIFYVGVLFFRYRKHFHFRDL